VADDGGEETLAGGRGGRFAHLVAGGDYAMTEESPMTANKAVDERGVVRGQAVLDLSHLTTADELAAITLIEGVGAVVVPESLAGGYAGIPSSGVGATVYVPDGAKVRVHVGPLTVGGDGLGTADEVLVVVGVLLIISPVTGELPRRISVVGSVVAPRGSESALGKVLASSMGSVGYYRYVAGQQVKVLTGQVRFSGASLANAVGGPDDVLVAAGQVIVTGAVTTVGYSQLFVVGQFIGPEASRAELEARLEAQGQIVWYRSDEPRVFLDDLELGPDYFRLLEHPVSLVVLGDLTIASGVTAELIREKISDIVLLGDAVAPAEVVPVLQLLATDTVGRIRTADGPRG
jgi:hypothetical protein